MKGLTYISWNNGWKDPLGWGFSINEGRIPNVHMQFRWLTIPRVIYACWGLNSRWCKIFKR